MPYLLLLIYISFISLGLPDAVLGAAWPMMYPSLHTPMEMAGSINMLVALGTVLSSYFSARVIARMGTGRLMVTSVFMTAIALLGYAISPSIPLIILFSLPLGLGAGAVDAALNSYVSLHYEARHMSWLHCFWGVGAALGPVMISLVSGLGASWRIGYLLIGVLQAALAMVLLKAVPLFKDSPIATDSQKGTQPRTGQLLRIPGVPYALAAFFLYCAMEALTGLWSSTYLVLTHNVSKESAAALAALFYAGITLGRLLNGFLTMRIGFLTNLRLGGLMMILGLSTLMLLPVAFAAPALFLVGFGCAPVYPMLMHRTPYSFGEQNSPYIIGLQMATAYVGTLSIPPLFGLIAGESHIHLLPVLGLALAILLIITIERREKLVAAARGKE